MAEQSMAAGIATPMTSSTHDEFHPESTSIDYTNSRHRWRGLITRFNVAGRKKFYRSFINVMEPTKDTTILDVGVTPDQTAADSNFFERWYPWPDRITATSIEDASNLELAHPGLTFIRTSGHRLPFDDGQFDVAFSTAVIEHVGDREQQAQFIAELLRVSKRFFVTTPNRWYPVELHTYYPLLHWLPQRYHQAALRRLGKSPWAETENLNLLDRRTLRALFPAGVTLTLSHARFFGFRSNLIAYGSPPPSASPAGSRQSRVETTVNNDPGRGGPSAT
jgi:SAM-dependent methyltransferase